MAKKTHSPKAAQTSAENSEQEEGGFGDTPFIPAGLALIESHGNKARQIDYK